MFYNDYYYNVMTVPINFTNSATIAESPGHAGEVTRLPSTTALSASTATYVPPANVISGPTAGYAVAFLPFNTPAAVNICGPWQIAATGLFASKNSFTISITLGVNLKYSGERPPVINKPL